MVCPTIVEFVRGIKDSIPVSTFIDLAPAVVSTLNDAVNDYEAFYRGVGGAEGRLS